MIPYDCVYLVKFEQVLFRSVQLIKAMDTKLEEKSNKNMKVQKY